MSGLETAIRNALDRADRSSAEVRARIYQSARQALESGLRKQDVSDPAILADQRHRLEQTIKIIETEERHRLGLLPVEPAPDFYHEAIPEDMEELVGETRDPASGEDFGSDHLRAERFDPSSGVDTLAPEILSGRPSGRIPVRGSGAASGRPSGARRKKRRGGYTRLFVTVMVLAFLAMGGWWAYTSGLLMSADERDTSVANPPAAVSEEDLPDEGGTGPRTLDSANTFSKDWIEIFKPTDVDRVSAGGLASAKLTTTGDGQVVRIISSSAEADANVRILLPEESPGLADGQQSTIAISLRSASDETVQVTVDCDFGSAATCERHRFTVSSQRSDALIQVLPGEGERNAQPALGINSDVDGKGRGVDLLAVRILPVP